MGYVQPTLETTKTHTLTRGQARLLAFTAGATVANLYYAQPLLSTIATSLHVSQTSASLLVTVTQLAYAAGLLFLVPVGDITRRRPLFTGLLGVVMVAVAASAVAPDLELLSALAVIMGLTAVVIQMLIPFAATLAAEDERTRMIGTVLSGLLTGILLSRTFAGIVAQVAGWRGVYAIAAVVMAATTVTVYRGLPDLPKEIDAGYGADPRGLQRGAERARPPLEKPYRRVRVRRVQRVLDDDLVPAGRPGLPVLSAGHRPVRAGGHRRGAGVRARRPVD